MPISILDAPVSSNTGLLTSGSVSAGSNRWALYVPLFTHGSDASGASSVTLGGQPMTLLNEADAAGRDVAIQLWALNESGISAMSGSALVTTGGGSDDEGGFFLTIQDADQALPSGANINSAVYPSTISGSLSLTRRADSWTFLAGLQDYQFTALSLGNPTHTQQVTFKNGAGSIGYQADSAGTSDATFSGGSARDTGLVAVNFIDAVAGATVTQADDTPEDSVEQSFTTSGLTGLITAATLAGTALTLSNTDPATSTSYTIDVASIIDETALPAIGVAQTLSVTATEGTATTSITPQPKAGWSVVTLSGTLDATPSGIKAGIEGNSDKTVSAGDVIYYNASGNTSISEAGTITTDADSFLCKLGQGGSATTPTTWTPFSVSMTGVIENGSSRAKSKRRNRKNFYYYAEAWKKGQK